MVESVPVHIGDIGCMFYSLLDEVKQRRNRLLFGIDLEEYVELPHTISDQVNNRTPGFYFADIKENNLKQYEDLLHRLLLDDPKWAAKFVVVTKDGEMVPKVEMCRKFLKEMESIRSIIGTLIYLSSGSPYRGTEFATTCVRNLPGGNIRNVRFMSGSLTLISGYNKTSPSVWPLFSVLFDYFLT